MNERTSFFTIPLDLVWMQPDTLLVLALSWEKCTFWIWWFQMSNDCGDLLIVVLAPPLGHFHLYKRNMRSCWEQCRWCCLSRFMLCRGWITVTLMTLMTSSITSRQTWQFYSRQLLKWWNNLYIVCSSRHTTHDVLINISAFSSCRRGFRLLVCLHYLISFFARKRIILKQSEAFPAAIKSPVFFIFSCQ